jgi:carboxypeptidase Taq
MEEKLQRLTELVAEIADINHSSALLGWDQQVYMPSGGAEERGYMIGTLDKIAHEKFTSDEMGKLLEDLKEFLPEFDQDSENYRIISVTARDYEKTICVPADFLTKKAQIVSLAQQGWLEARAKSDFSIFRPHLEKVIDLSREYVSFFPLADHPYDTLLDSFEPGMKTADVQSIFDELRPQQVKLISTISQLPQIDDSFLHLDYNENDMWAFSAKVASAFGYDWKRGRQDPTAHPFCQSIGIDDVRITSRWVPELPYALLFGTMHETGHALYEQGIGHTWRRTALEGGASLGLHESQSRLWENLVGRSRGFWEYFYPQLKDCFKTQLGNVSLDQFYRAINKVKPSFIRVEADEATYNLHIMLRLELEIAMLAGSINIQDLPEIWKEKMKDYLGVIPPNDAKGVLQDIHWSGGMMGYFSTYALGNLISAQLWEKFKSINPDIDTQLRQGDFSSLLSWLRVKIHQYGRKYEPQELVQRVTKSRIESGPYLRYLNTKYSEIYSI